MRAFASAHDCGRAALEGFAGPCYGLHGATITIRSVLLDVGRRCIIGNDAFGNDDIEGQAEGGYAVGGKGEGKGGDLLNGICGKPCLGRLVVARYAVFPIDIHVVDTLATATNLVDVGR